MIIDNKENRPLSERAESAASDFSHTLSIERLNSLVSLMNFRWRLSLLASALLTIIFVASVKYGNGGVFLSGGDGLVYCAALLIILSTELPQYSRMKALKLARRMIIGKEELDSPSLRYDGVDLVKGDLSDNFEELVKENKIAKSLESQNIKFHHLAIFSLRAMKAFLFTIFVALLLFFAADTALSEKFIQAQKEDLFTVLKVLTLLTVILYFPLLFVEKKATSFEYDKVKSIKW